MNANLIPLRRIDHKAVREEFVLRSELAVLNCYNFADGQALKREAEEKARARKEAGQTT
ncbi:MAG: hypothetical protein HQK81_10900 [Desulfovibrionaceae bacterium]|nr:hypothetical protein [Desulfovibrionaceae bacterium]MBF0514549.1 hypothetical protein [Desulfovibrionaceae bacterium]